MLNCPICNAEMEPDRDVCGVGGAFAVQCPGCCYRGPYSDSWDAAVESWDAIRDETAEALSVEEADRWLD